jgi:hypothetical protein
MAARVPAKARASLKKRILVDVLDSVDDGLLEQHYCERLYEEQDVCIRTCTTGADRLRGSGASAGEREFEWVHSA